MLKIGPIAIGLLLAISSFAAAGANARTLRSACNADTAKFCNDVRKSRATACLKRHMPDLSRGCANALKASERF